MKKAFLFSGQGSQYYQMGYSLYRACPVFRAHMDAYNEIASDLAGYSLLDVLYGGRKRTDPFDQTSLAGVSICMVELALSATLIHHDQMPDCVVGSSLGVFAAAVVADVFNAEQALSLTYRQGQVFEQCCDEGAMMAVLASPALYQSWPILRDTAEVAAIHFDKHFVISMPLAAVNQVEDALHRSEAAFQRMAVSRAFHSRWVDPAQHAFKASADTMLFKMPRMPLVCCAPAGPLPILSADTLWNTVRQPIRFQTTIEALEREGPWQYIDVGPSGTLATFMKYLLPKGTKSTAQAMMTVFDRDISLMQALVPRFKPQIR